MANKTPGKSGKSRKSKKSKKRKWTEEEVKQWYQDTGVFAYANPDDGNIVVKKPRSEGLTVNWANPKAYWLLGAILAIVFGVCGCVFHQLSFVR